MLKFGRGLLLFVLLVMVSGMGITLWSVKAQDAAFPTLTPPPSPTNNGGASRWQVETQSFTSDYPLGFAFTLKASSSGGKIRNATALWKHSPATLRRVGGVFNAETETWNFYWNSTAGPIPAWVGLQYWFVLEDEQGNLYQTETWHSEYADNSKSWGRAESEDIIVFWERPIPDSFGQMALDAMKEQREFYRAGFGSLLTYKPRAIVYASRGSYYEWDLNSGTTGRRDVGLTSSAWGGTVQYDYNSNLQETAYGTILHEVAHLYQSDKRQPTGIRWWYEGQATFFELQKGVMYDYLSRVKRMVQEQGLGSIRDNWVLTGSGRVEYDIGYSFIRFLVETYGIETHLRITELMREGKTLFAAIEGATEQTLDDVELAFRVWLGLENTAVPTAQPTMGFSFPPTPTFAP